MTYSATLAHNLRMFSCAMKAISGSLNQRDQFDLMRHTLQLHADDPARVAAVNDFIDGVQIGMGCAGTILRSWLLENAPASSDFDPASAQKTVERYDWQDRKDLS
ncbi:hypothetical protein [Roseobacter sp. N2S]|uniref:hypothetical protein n=1 Tax=Roseobacter sp. N2S TaxID=2663844 RepID=UPI00285D0730|nr:hypothetical protein [Roseobacter sp. N2S]MDR6266559.1 hypothetical protein [Roseobacter sp. N2S]